MTDIAKVREMSDKELVDALQQAKQDLWSARFALSTRQLNDTSSIPQTRRTRSPASSPSSASAATGRGAAGDRRGGTQRRALERARRRWP